MRLWPARRGPIDERADVRSFVRRALRRGADGVAAALAREASVRDLEITFVRTGPAASSGWSRSSKSKPRRVASVMGRWRPRTPRRCSTPRFKTAGAIPKRLA